MVHIGHSIWHRIIFPWVITPVIALVEIQFARYWNLSHLKRMMGYSEVFWIDLGQGWDSECEPSLHCLTSCSMELSPDSTYNNDQQLQCWPLLDHLKVGHWPLARHFAQQHLIKGSETEAPSAGSPLKLMKAGCDGTRTSKSNPQLFRAASYPTFFFWAVSMSSIMAFLCLVVLKKNNNDHHIYIYILQHLFKILQGSCHGWKLATCQGTPTLAPMTPAPEEHQTRHS